MRFFRRVIAVAFIVALMISSMAFAHEDFNGDMTIEEGAAVFVESAEARLLRLSKEAAVENDIQSRVNRNSDGYTILNVTPFQQETDHYCGPATVKQVVHYIMGSSYSQDFYANCLETTTDGTDMTVIPGVLNTAIGQNYYVYDPIDSETEWYTEIAQAPVDLKVTVQLCFLRNQSTWFIKTTDKNKRVKDVFAKFNVDVIWLSQFRTCCCSPGKSSFWSTVLRNKKPSTKDQIVILL